MAREKRKRRSNAQLFRLKRQREARLVSERFTLGEAEFIAGHNASINSRRDQGPGQREVSRTIEKWRKERKNLTKVLRDQGLTDREIHDFYFQNEVRNIRIWEQELGFVWDELDEAYAA